MERQPRPIPEATVQAPEIMLPPVDERVSKLQASLDTAMEKLRSGVLDTMDSSEFQDFLKSMALFHTYSFNNTMLILSQRPDATKVAGYSTWKKQERFVKQGERGMAIFVPHLKMEKDPVTGEKQETLLGWGIGHVFDIAQTDGKPLPIPPRAKELESSTEQGKLIYNWTADYLAGRGVAVFKREPLSSRGARGEYIPGPPAKIHIHPELSDDMAAKTLVHEASHHVANHRFNDHREDIEAVAEGAAFVAMSHWGVDTGDYSFSYVSQWAKDKAVFQRNLQAIQSTAKTIIQGVENSKVPF